MTPQHPKPMSTRTTITTAQTKTTSPYTTHPKKETNHNTNDPPPGMPTLPHPHQPTQCRHPTPSHTKLPVLTPLSRPPPPLSPTHRAPQPLTQLQSPKSENHSPHINIPSPRKCPATPPTPPTTITQPIRRRPIRTAPTHRPLPPAPSHTFPSPTRHQTMTPNHTRTYLKQPQKCKSLPRY